MRQSVIGKPIPRVEAPTKVTGRCLYASDVARPDALCGGFVRSPYAHARILNIDTTRARSLRGIKAIVTGMDVPPRLFGIGLKDKPVLARDRVRYVGEKVVGIAAIDKDTLEDALELIEVEYEELPSVFDPVESLKAEAPTLHPDYATYEGPNKAPSLKNVQSVERTAKGDIDQGFSESDHIFENTFRTHMVHQAFIEPRACTVEIDHQGRIAVWHCHQAPFSVRRGLAAHTDIPEEMIVIHPVSIGGSFGGKLGYEDVLSAYYLARASGKPVKLNQSYVEELLDGEPRHPSVVVLRTGVKRGGRLWAWDGKIFYNGGAYGARTPRNGLNGTYLLAGSYRTPHTRMEGYSVYTNQVPCGFFRAPGEVQTLFGVESHMDMMAEALGIDPLEFRLRNALVEGDKKPNGEPLRDPRGREILEKIRDLFRWNQAPLRSPKVSTGRLTGRGLGFGDRHIGTGKSNAELILEGDGSLRLLTSVRDQGVGAHTMHRQVAAEILEIDPEAVQIKVTGTEGPFDEGVRGQRGTHIEGQAVSKAAESLVEQLLEEAARFWKVDRQQVKWARGHAWLQSPRKKSLSLRDLASMVPNGEIRATGHWKGGRPPYYAFQALAAEVAVDPETGQISVKRLTFALDVTKVINPTLHQGQIDGAVMQGVGHSLIENMVGEDGRVLTLSLGDYKIPTIRDVPLLTTALVHAEEGPGPFGAKAVAEAAIGIVAPAIANAVYDATGVRIQDLPITAEKVLQGLREIRPHEGLRKQAKK